MSDLQHPYDNLKGGFWLRGNLHTHTTRSDGKRSIQEVVCDYAARSYDFLMISDHDLLASTKDYQQIDDKGLILIPGNEISLNGPHLLHVNADRRITPYAQRQRSINQASKGPGFIIANHPNWQATFDHCPIARLQEWVGYAGLEIYNGTIGRLDGSPYATDKWDILLARGLRLWGYATDDSHLPQADVGLGWNMVYTRRRSLAAVVQALRSGRFYASTGLSIRSIRVRKNRIRIQTDKVCRIVAVMQIGRRFAQADATELEVEVPPNASYVRFECLGAGEAYAWTQPFFPGTAGQ